MHASRSPTHLRSLDGIAVISDIVSSSEPERAARDLAGMMSKCKEEIKADEGRFRVFKTGNLGVGGRKTRDEWVEGVVGLMGVVKDHKPLAHQVGPDRFLGFLCLLLKLKVTVLFDRQMTNIVVANDSANATLALGGSPIMATHPRDVKDLSKIIDALLINFGWVQACFLLL